MDDGGGKLVGGGLAAQILGADLAGLEHVLHGLEDHLAVVQQVDVAQHLGRAEQDRARVGDVLADALGERVARALRKRKRVLLVGK